MVGKSPRTALPIFFLFAAALILGKGSLAQETAPQDLSEQATVGSPTSGSPTSAPAASAPNPYKKVIILYSDRENTAVRIAAESQSLGFVPLREEAPSGMSDAQLSSIATERSAEAVMWIRDDGRVKVWVENPSDPAAARVQEVSVAESGEQADALIAFKAAELLRASLIAVPEVSREKADASKAPPSVVPPEKGDAKTPSPNGQEIDRKKAKNRSQYPPARLSLAFQPAAVFGFGDFPPSFTLGLTLHVHLASRFFFDVGGFVPIFPMKTEAEPGALRAKAGLVRGRISVALISPERRLVPYVALFCGGLVFKVESETESDHRTQSTLFGAAVPGGSFALHFRVTPIVALRLDVDAGIALPTPVLLDEAEKIFSFGKPLVSVLFGVDIRLF